MSLRKSSTGVTTTIAAPVNEEKYQRTCTTARQLCLKVLQGSEEWLEDDVLDAVYWFKQALSLVVGLVLGFLPVIGISGFLIYGLSVLGCTIMFVRSGLRVDPDDFGGLQGLLGEGVMPSTAVFLYYEEVWSNGAVELLDGIMAEAHEQHDKILQPGKISVGRSSMAKGIVGYRRAYPDLKFKVNTAGVASDLSSVFVSWSASGTNLGSIRDQPPSGKYMAFDGISHLMFDEDGKIFQSLVFRQAPDDERKYFTGPAAADKPAASVPTTGSA